MPGKPIPEDLRFRSVRFAEAAGGEKGSIFLPWEFPPLNSIPLDVVDSRSMAPTTTATFLIFDARANDAVLRFWANELNAAAGYPEIFWSILIDNTGYPPYVNMQWSRGAVNNPDPILIHISKGSRCDVTVQNVSGANTWVVNTRLKGWIY